MQRAVDRPDEHADQLRHLWDVGRLGEQPLTRRERLFDPRPDDAPQVFLGLARFGGPGPEHPAAQRAGVRSAT